MAVGAAGWGQWERSDVLSRAAGRQGGVREGEGSGRAGLEVVPCGRGRGERMHRERVAVPARGDVTAVAKLQIALS